MIIVSRESITKKNFDVTEKQLRENLEGKELEEALELLPTPEEREWMKIFQSNAPELARMRRKMSVCLDAEIKILEENHILYEYCKTEYEIKAPINSFKILKALESSKSDAFEEMAKQGCLKKDGKDIDLKIEPVDSLKLMFIIADKFFFQIYLA